LASSAASRKLAPAARARAEGFAIVLQSHRLELARVSGNHRVVRKPHGLLNFGRRVEVARQQVMQDPQIVGLGETQTRVEQHRLQALLHGLLRVEAQHLRQYVGTGRSLRELEITLDVTQPVLWRS
jgi:hypothetical protein